MDTKSRVGLRIRSIRKQRNLTQDELAERLGRSVDAISNLERGLSYPSFETLERLGVELGIPIKEFFEFKGGEDISTSRAELLETLDAIVSELDDRQLQIAVNQLMALKG